MGVSPLGRNSDCQCGQYASKSDDSSGMCLTKSNKSYSTSSMIKDIADSIKRIDKDNPWKTGKQYFSTRGKYVHAPQLPPPNPDPANFKVEQLFVVGPHIVAVIRYPNCTNYEGLKVMLFRNIPLDQFSNLKWIDPHFCNGNHVSPFARFEPTQEGIDVAVFVAKNMGAV